MTFKSAERRHFFHGGAELFEFVMRVFLMFTLGLVAGEFHPHFRADALVSVSYTHLDVYKRQGIELAERVRPL